MKLVHLSDLHLGFRAFPRSERGWNLRERDLASSFHQAVLEIARIGPEVVVISGDVFDRPDPPSTAFLTLTRGIGILRAHLPAVQVLAIAGARDTPLVRADPGPVAVLDAIPGVEAASGAPRAVHSRELGLHALLVPHRAALRPPFPELRPSPDANRNILVIRGGFGDGEDALTLDPKDWDYVAVGGGHEAEELAPNVWVAGSLERTGWDPWREATEEKGFLVFDLDSGDADFHPVTGRPVVDLAPVRVSAEDPDGGSRRLRDLLDGVPGGVEGKIVRVRLRGDILLPSQGVSAGLLSAVRKRTAHAELRLSAEGEPRTRVPRARSQAPRVVGVRWGPAPLDRIVLTHGILAITSESDFPTERLKRALGDEGSGGEGALPPLSLGLELAGEWSEWDRLAAFRGGTPEELLIRSVARLERDDPARSPGDSADPDRSMADEKSASVEGAENELQEARADAVEAAGDLEARAMEWARERQDAESHLLAYRDQARELKARLRQLETEGRESSCPTCGLPVGDHLPMLEQTLREEWDGVVQDGKWWKRRREQLDEKPVDLQEMEGRAIRLQARVTALSTAGASPERAVAPPKGNSKMQGTQGVAALSGSPVARALLRRSGSVVHRLTQGRLTGMLPTDAGIQVEEEGKYLRAPSSGEKAALTWAIRVTTSEMLWEEGEPVGGMVFGEFASGDGVRFIPPALEVLRSSPLAEAPVLMVLPAAAAAASSELFSAILELQGDGEGRGGWRRLPGGSPALRWVG